MSSFCTVAQLVKFVNINDFVINFDNLGSVTIEYVVDKKVGVSCRDWVAIFPKGCDFLKSINLDLMVSYEFVLNKFVNKEERRFTMQFSLKGARNLKREQQYQFVYCSKNTEVLGISEAFRFIESTPREIVLQPSTSPAQSNNNEGESPVETQYFRGNKRRNGRSKLNFMNFQRSERDANSVDRVDWREKAVVNKNSKNKQSFVNKMQMFSMRGSASDSRVMPPCQSPTSCSNCQRVGVLLQTQGELYNKIKNLAEMNGDLQKQIYQLQKQIELGQAAYQKLSVTLMHEREMKLLYQVASSDRLFEHHLEVICAYQHIFLGLDNFQRPVYTIRPIFQLAPTVTEQQIMAAENTQGMLTPRDASLEKQRAEEKARVGSVLKLKAIIGSQEEKIRYLTDKLAELEMGKVQKVRAIVKNIEQLDSENKNQSNVDGVATNN